MGRTRKPNKKGVIRAAVPVTTPSQKKDTNSHHQIPRKPVASTSTPANKFAQKRDINTFPTIAQKPHKPVPSTPVSTNEPSKTREHDCFPRTPRKLNNSSNLAPAPAPVPTDIPFNERDINTPPQISRPIKRTRKQAAAASGRPKEPTRGRAAVPGYVQPQHHKQAPANQKSSVWERPPKTTCPQAGPVKTAPVHDRDIVRVDAEVTHVYNNVEMNYGKKRSRCVILLEFGDVYRYLGW
jgi:hypothetical protein